VHHEYGRLTLATVGLLFLVSVIVISFLFSFSHNRLFLDFFMFYITVLPFQFLLFRFHLKHFQFF